MAEQLIFDLPTKAALGRDAYFVVPSNAVAVQALEQWQDWPNARMLLWGPKGAGKTHLAHVWATESGAVIVDALSLTDQTVEALAEAPALVVEDADRLVGNLATETALFHLYNLMQAKGGYLMITATLAPARWGAGLDDLISRMQAMPLVKLETPDDALLAAMMIKLFADIQIAIGPELIPYLLDRIERSTEAVNQVVAALDLAALTKKRPVNRRLAAEVLDNRAPRKA